MSKTEDRAAKKALKKFPILFGERMGYDKTNLQQERRNAYEKGYHQAEKDLELTWENIKIILDIEDDILSECNSHKELVIETYPKGEDYYGEILNRFKDSKKCQIRNTE